MPTSAAGLDVIRRATSELKRVIEDPDGENISLRTAQDLPAALESLGFAIADYLGELAIEDKGDAYTARRHPAYANELAQKARDLSFAARSAGPIIR
jgi:hypothetical protein